jgi:hypothetical protein
MFGTKAVDGDVRISLDMAEVRPRVEVAVRALHGLDDATQLAGALALVMCALKGPNAASLCRAVAEIVPQVAPLFSPVATS